MVFKRRTKRSFLQGLRHAIYPKGGYLRAIWYVLHRVRRLPDQPHRIARGVAAGVFVSFTPFFGFHFVIAAGLAWLMGGNIVASLLATFFGNPLTFPIIMAVAIELGAILTGHHGVPLHEVVSAFAHASVSIWDNGRALLTGHPTHWAGLITFFHEVFWPYFIGGLIPGIVSGLTAYYLSLPLIGAYQKRRQKKLKERVEKLHEQKLRAATKAAAPETHDG